MGHRSILAAMAHIPPPFTNSQSPSLSLPNREQYCPITSFPHRTERFFRTYQHTWWQQSQRTCPWHRRSMEFVLVLHIKMLFSVYGADWRDRHTAGTDSVSNLGQWNTQQQCSEKKSILINILWLSQCLLVSIGIKFPWQSCIYIFFLSRDPIKSWGWLC